MMKKFLIFSVFFAVFLLPAVASAATYTVRQDGTGNYTTIQACANAAQAGDTCLVYPGVYNERVSFANSGTASGKITFRAETRRAANVLNGFDIGGKSYIRIEGFSITDDPTIDSADAVVRMDAMTTNVEVVDNYIHDLVPDNVRTTVPGGGIFALGENNYVARNHIYKTNKGIVVWGKNILVEYNEIERLVQAPDPYGWDADYMRVFGENIVIRNNYMHGTTEQEIGTAHTDGIQFFDDNGEYLRNVVIENNIYRDFYHQGFFMDGSTYYRTSETGNITIRNNLYADGGIGINIISVKGVKVYNNVFTNLGLYGIYAHERTGSPNKPPAVEVKNNIFYNIYTGGSYIYATDNSLPASFISGGYNLINEAPPWTLSTDIVNTDPRFVNVSSLFGSDGLPRTVDDGFQLQAGSAAIDNGTALTGFNNDIIGTIRPQGSRWDIGAYEYASGTLPPTTYLLNVTKSGTGTVTGTGINCGTDCSESYNSGTTASLSSGSTFAGWGGACTGTGASCSVTMNANKIVTATFATSGRVINALSANYNDVLNAVNNANDGDTVQIPAGTGIWASTLNINKSITLKGSGVDLTKISGQSGVPFTLISIEPAINIPIRVTGIHFSSPDYMPSLGGYQIAVKVNGIVAELNNIRIDHSRFTNGTDMVWVRGFAYPVVDHNEFVDNLISIRLIGQDNISWTREIAPGTKNAVFIEDNTFNYKDVPGSGAGTCSRADSMVYQQQGTRLVYRYNTVTNNCHILYQNAVDGHGNQPGGLDPLSMRGTIMTEIYGNTWNFWGISGAVSVRGGSHLIYNNTLNCISTTCNPFRFTDEEGWNSGGQWATKPYRTIWPAYDQIFNSFIWGNKRNGVSYNTVYLPATTINGLGYDDIFIKENRDFFYHAPESSGGKEIFPTFPGNDDMVFTSSSPNAYYPYTPYVYPHPSVSVTVGTGSPTPALSSCANPTGGTFSTAAAPCPTLAISKDTITSTEPITITLAPRSRQYIYKTIYISNPVTKTWTDKDLTSCGDNWCTTADGAAHTLTLNSSDISLLGGIGTHYVASWDWTWNGTCWLGPGTTSCDTPGKWRVQKFEVSNGTPLPTPGPLPTPYALSVTKQGEGTITSSPTGINCGSTCNASFNSGTSVTLTASPSSGSSFYGWSGGVCSGTGTCSVAMNSAKSVTATFNTTVTGNQPPTVSISAQPTSATAPANITLSASASDSDGSIASVQFYNGSTLLGSDSSSPYSFSWSNVAAGTYSLTTRAYDNSGANTTSNAVTVTVNASSGGGTGTIYYVSTSGSDSNTGTLTSPFRTIHKGMSYLHSGDTLYVRAGTYDESFGSEMAFDNSTATSFGQAITISAYNGEQVIIKPSSGYRVFTFESLKYAYLILDGLIIDAANTTSDAVKISYGSDPRQASHHIWIRNSIIKNAYSNGVLTSGEANGNKFTNVDVYNNGFKQFAADGRHPYGFYIESSNNIIENSKIHDNVAYGVHVYSDTRILSNNIVRNNLIYDNGRAYPRAGIILSSGPNHEAYGNIIWGNTNGIDIYYGGAQAITNVKVHDNTIYRNGGTYILDENGLNSAGIHNNTLINQDAPATMPDIPR